MEKERKTHAPDAKHMQIDEVKLLEVEIGILSKSRQLRIFFRIFWDLRNPQARCDIQARDGGVHRESGADEQLSGCLAAREQALAGGAAMAAMAMAEMVVSPSHR